MQCYSVFLLAFPLQCYITSDITLIHSTVPTKKWRPTFEFLLEWSFFSWPSDCHSFNFNYRGGFSRKETLCSVMSLYLVVDISWMDKSRLHKASWLQNWPAVSQEKSLVYLLGASNHKGRSRAEHFQCIQSKSTCAYNYTKLLVLFCKVLDF